VDDKGIVTIVQDTTTSHASKVENNRLVVVDEAEPTPPTPEEPEQPVTTLVPEKPEKPSRLPKTGQPEQPKNKQSKNEQPKNESSVEKASNRQELPKTGSHYELYSVFLGIVLEGTAVYLLLRKLQRKGN
ncbi:hypothetical protein ACWOEL_11250, partial [Enterococcus columbae]